MRVRAAAFALALGIAACQPGYRFDPATDYVFVGVHVWDGTGTLPSELAVVQIGQGRILAIDPIFGGADESAGTADTAAVLADILTDGRALEIAQANLGRLSEAGVPIAFGTDSGPLGRFQGYFEHMEMELMAEAGLTPEQILRSATGVAADCLGRDDIGTLEPGRRADFVIVRGDPIEDVGNLREILGVWVGGERVAGG